MTYSLEALQSAVANAAADRMRGKSERHRKLYRRKTASWLDDCFFRILRSLKVKHLVECGAHEAAASVRFIRDGGALALAVEANPFTFSTKTVHAQHTEGVVVVNCGVGVEPGELDFFIPASGSTDGSASFLRKEGVEYFSQRVKVLTLDALYRENFSVVERTGLWIDVEGLGLDVLRGGSQLLEQPNCLVIKIEVEAAQFWSGQSRSDAVNKYLESVGFVPVLRDMEYPGQYNLIYIRADHVAGLDEVLLQSWIELREVDLIWAEWWEASLKNLRKRFLKPLGKSQSD